MRKFAVLFLMLLCTCSVFAKETESKTFLVLFKAKELWKDHSVDELKKIVAELISSEKQLRLEYFEISDIQTLQAMKNGEKKNAVACIAVQLGDVRLIDNIVLG